MSFLAKEVQHLKQSAGTILHGKREGTGSEKPSAAAPVEGHDGGGAAVPEVVHAHNTLHAETIPTYT